MADKEKWITLKNGKKVKLDENGTVIAGFPEFMGKNVSDLGDTTEVKKYSPPRKTLSSYLSENNDKRKAAEDYFEDNLQNTYVKTRTSDGKELDIHFTKNTAGKLYDNLTKDPDLSYFVSDLPNVLQHFSHDGKNTKPRTDYDGFYYFEKKITKTIPQEGKNKDKTKKITAIVKIDVGIRRNRIDFYEAYSTSKKIAKDKKNSCVPEYERLDQRENPAAATVGKSSSHQKCNYNKNIPIQGEVVNINIEILEDEPMNNNKNVIFDSKSKRSFDINGFMHVELSNLTKESVDPYFGYEIVNSEALGFEPDKIYFGYRKGEELKKAAQTFNGLPLMREHHFDSAEKPQREHRVGSVGTDCIYKEEKIVS